MATSIPPAPTNRRQITKHITTHYGNRTDSNDNPIIFATYSERQEYNTPYAAPAYVYVKPAGTRWFGEVVLQGVAHSEVDALSALLDTLVDLGQGGAFEISQAEDIRRALHADVPGTAWEFRPLITRGPKPRAPRHDVTDAVTGERVMLYKDTLKPHRDPNCTCARCNVITNTETE